jgi:hypothetical protein
METRQLSINELIADQTVDHGHVLTPPDDHGMVIWSAPRRNEAIGRLMQSLPQEGLARSFSCGYCYVNCYQAIVSPNTAVNGNVGDVQTLGDIEPKECTNNCSANCGGTWDGSYGSDDTYSWTSNSIATTSSGDISANYTIVGAGTGTVTYRGWISDQLPRCTSSGTAPTTGHPTISGPSTVWWFNGKNPPGYATSITLVSSGGASTTWTVTAGGSEVHLSSGSGQSITVTGTGTFSQSLNDVQIVASAGGVNSPAFGLTSMGPKFFARSTKIDSPCSGTGEQGWESDIKYTLRDNINNPMGTVPINEAFSGLTTWPQITSTGGTTASDGTFHDVILVCALPGGLKPMPTSPQQPEGNTLVDSFSQTWCGGVNVSNPWGSGCQGAQVQSGTVKRYIDHGDVTVP